MNWKHLKFEEINNIAILTINNPDKMNSMNLKFIYDMLEALEYCENRKEIRCVILTGAGNKAFSAGGDIKAERRFNPKEVKEYNEQGGNIVKKILNSRLPFIAAVNGYALGAAFSFVVACDIAISSDNAIYGIPTPSLGGIPGWGCTQIARVIGEKNAKLLLLANERFNAEEAKSIGLVNKVVKQNELMEEAMKYAERIALFAPNVMKATKYAVNEGLKYNLDEGFAIEESMLNQCNSEYNFKEGISAFLGKRPAQFKML